MSSRKQVTSETTALLGDSRLPGWSSWSPSRFSPETLLIPVALATRLAAQIPSTTLVELIRRAVCRLWNLSHDDQSTLPVGAINPELCDAPEIERYFASAIAIFAATEGIMSVAGCGVLSRISTHYGRKPAFLLTLTAGTIGSCMIPGSQYVPDWLADWVFIVGSLFSLFSGSLPYVYLINMYVVDVCAPEDRTAALSKIAGWASLGICISFALGGSVTVITGNPLIVFYIAAVMFAGAYIYVSSFLPESFPEDKRTTLSRTCSEPSADRRATTPFFAALQIFEPMRMLIPTRRLDGTSNWRLTWCGVHSFVFAAANGYGLAAWMVLATSKYHLTPADTGLLLTIATVSSTITLMVIVPTLVRFLRPYYRRQPPFVGDSIINSEELKLETSDRLDVHMAFAACVITAVFFLSAAASPAGLVLVFSGICIGFSYVHTPTVRSLVAGSVDPLRQGEALAAIEMVSNAGSFLSPIVMGSILTATINSMPLLTFYVHLVVVLVGGALLFLVRDEDRYRKPHET